MKQMIDQDRCQTIVIPVQALLNFCSFLPSVILIN